MENKPSKPLPASLLKQFQKWKSTRFEEYKDLHKKLSQEGQSPEAMIVSCCDSRVNPTSIFDANIGQFFVHRNIANLVPPCEIDYDHSGISATLEYAIENLKISHLIILGHSSCGGIRGGYELYKNNLLGSDKKNSFLQEWLRVLLPAIKKLDRNLPCEKAISELEKLSIVTSMDNVLTYPFARTAFENSMLSIYGLWYNISSGDLEQYNSETKTFEFIG